MSKNSKTKPHKLAKFAPVASPLAIYTTGEAADLLSVGRTKFMSLVRTGRIRVLMLDGRIRIPHEALVEFRSKIPAGYVCGAKPGEVAAP